MCQIKKNILTNEIIYKDTVILTYQIEYPEIVSCNSSKGKEFFNYENGKNALVLQQYSEGELFLQAKETYEYNAINGYPTMVYQLVRNYEITYYKQNIVSLFTDTYTFTGGAHGMTIREGQTWNLQEKRQIPLSCFYYQDPNYILGILREINRQIEGQIQVGSNQYFDDYCKLVLEAFNSLNYYITKDSIVIFFQQYDIAPYSSGIPTFLIPRSCNKQ